MVANIIQSTILTWSLILYDISLPNLELGGKFSFLILGSPGYVLTLKKHIIGAGYCLLGCETALKLPEQLSWVRILMQLVGYK